MHKLRELAESPWVWLAVFSAAGLVALLVIAPKHARRQERLERMHHARQARVPAEAPGTADERPQPAKPASTLAVAIVLALVIAGGIVVSLVARNFLLTDAARPDEIEQSADDG